MTSYKQEKYKRGDRVVRKLHGAGVVTFSDGVVLKVNKQGVWLDNGGGNRPSGPFVNGKMIGCFGFWEEIYLAVLCDGGGKA